MEDGQEVGETSTLVMSYDGLCSSIWSDGAGGYR